MTEAEWMDLYRQALKERDEFHLKMCKACDEAARYEFEALRLRREIARLSAAAPSAASGVEER